MTLRRRRPIRRSSRALPSAALALLARAALALLALAAACSPEVQDGAGPIVPVPNVTGLAARQGAPAADLEVELRDLSGETLDDTRSDAQGEYAFAEVPPGGWDVKVSGDEPGDFDSVSLVFQLDAEDDPLLLPPLDVHAYGAAMLEPADSAALPWPDPTQPSSYPVFRWTPPALDYASARVKLYDADGAPVWTSPAETANEAAWNGIGNEGAYADRLVTGARLSWRLKLDLAGGGEARLPMRALRFEGEAPLGAEAAGRVLREAEPAPGLSVVLRDAQSEDLIEVTTAADGAFVIPFVSAGSWELKVSGDEAGDFDSVSLFLEVTGVETPIAVPDLDISAHGAAPLAPADGASLPVPSFGEPLSFVWTPPEAPLEWASVKLYDAQDRLVWDSPKSLAGDALWNGLGEYEEYAGHFVPAGDYGWRLRFGLAGGAEARLGMHRLHLLEGR